MLIPFILSCNYFIQCTVNIRENFILYNFQMNNFLLILFPQFKTISSFLCYLGRFSDFFLITRNNIYFNIFHAFHTTVDKNFFFFFNRKQLCSVDSQIRLDQIVLRIYCGTICMTCHITALNYIFRKPKVDLKKSSIQLF